MSRQMILKMAGLSDRNAGLNNGPITQKKADPLEALFIVPDITGRINIAFLSILVQIKDGQMDTVELVERIR